MNKIQAFNLVIASGTAATRKEFRCTLDNEFDMANGYYAIENKNGGLTTQWKIGLKDDTRTYMDLVNGKHLQASTAYPIKDRFYGNQQIAAKGRVVEACKCLPFTKSI